MVRYAAFLAILVLILLTMPAWPACRLGQTCIAPSGNYYDNSAQDERNRQRELDDLRRQRDEAERAYIRERALDAQRREESRRDPSGILAPRRHY